MSIDIVEAVWLQRFKERRASRLIAREWCTKFNVKYSLYQAWYERLMCREEIRMQMSYGKRLKDLSDGEDKAALWDEILQVQRDSDMSPEDWCAKEGIDLHRFYEQRKEADFAFDIEEYKRAEGWRKLIKEREASGLTVSDWCKNNNISERTYAKWHTRLFNGCADAAFWNNVFKCRIASGLTVAEWCKENGITKHSYRTWYTKLKVAGLLDDDSVDRRSLKTTKYTLSDWKEKVLAQQKSGFSIRAWCKEVGISHSAFIYWRNKLANESESTVEPESVVTKSVGKPERVVEEVTEPESADVESAVEPESVTEPVRKTEPCLTVNGPLHSYVIHNEQEAHLAAVFARELAAGK